MALTFYKSLIKVGGTNKLAVVANYKHDDLSKVITERHHILIFDRSGSMYSTLGKLIENMKKVIETISENDYITILWFSGAGQYKTLVKGAKKGKQLYKLLDTVNHTVGCTCFSEVIKEAGEIINELKVICPNFTVNLFTDGEACTNRPDEEEYALAKKEAEKFAADILAFNTIGYGNYYNQQFLKDLAEVTPYGVMCHSSKIDEYFDILTENLERLKDLAVGSLVTVAKGADVLYVSNKYSKLAKDELALGMLDKTKNQIVMIADSEFEFEINDETFNSKDIKKAIPKSTLTPVMYAYAYGNYYNGNRELALKVLATTLKDKFLVDEQFKAFTFDECAAYSKNLKKAITSAKARLVGGACEDNYLPADDATCLMDIIKILINGDSKYVYSDNYKRIGIPMVDKIAKFEKSKLVPVTPIQDVVFNATKLNVSIQSTLYGTVKLTAKDAKFLGLDKVVDSRAYRNQTIVQDGNLNVEKIDVVVSADTLQELQDLGIKGLVAKTSRKVAEIKKSLKEDDKESEIIGLDLTKVPVINRMYLDGVGSTENVLENTLEINKLAVKQKVLNFLKKQVNTSGFSDEQLKLLKETYGLNGTLEYVGKMEKPDDAPEDSYITREIEFQIKGSASIPSIKDVVKKVEEKKDLKGNAALMNSYINELETEFNKTLKKASKKSTAKSKSATLSKKLQNDEVEKVSLLNCEVSEVPGLYDFVAKKLKEVKLEKLACSIEQSSVKMAKVLTGSWFEGLTEDGKGGYSFSKDGDTLIIKTKRTEVKF